MSLQVEAIDPATYTYADARAAAAMLSESFAGEPYPRLLWGPELEFLHHLPIGPEHARAHRAFLRVQALAILYAVRGAEARGFEAKKSGHLVGFVAWQPARATLAAGPRRSLRLRLRQYKTLAQLLACNWWYYGFGRSPVIPSPGARALGRNAGLGARTQFEDDAAEAARRAELAHLPPGELGGTQYPLHEAHYCEVMAVAVAWQRQGIGRKLFVESANRLPVYAPEFSDGKGTTVRAPPQYLLHSTEAAKSLYTSLGFVSVHRHTETVEGVEVTRELFVKGTPFGSSGLEARP